MYILYVYLCQSIHRPIYHICCTGVNPPIDLSIISAVPAAIHPIDISIIYVHLCQSTHRHIYYICCTCGNPPHRPIYHICLPVSIHPIDLSIISAVPAAIYPIDLSIIPYMFTCVNPPIDLSIISAVPAAIYPLDLSNIFTLHVAIYSITTNINSTITNTDFIVCLEPKSDHMT
jgi:hypothetical protein